MDFFRKHRRIIFIITIAAFLGGSFVGLGSALFYPSGKNAVIVNDSKVPVKLFDSIYANSIDMYKRSSNGILTEDIIKEIKVKIVQALVEDEIFYQQSKIYGIVVSDDEIKIDLQNSAMFRNSNNIFDLNIYDSFLKSIQMSAKEYEKLRRKQIAGNKVKSMLASSVRLWNYEVEEAIKLNPSENVNSLLQIKINIVLNEWYSAIIRNSKIIMNDDILLNK
jgi:hypothetical protein